MTNEIHQKAKEEACVEHFDQKSESWSALYKRAAFRDRLKLFRDLSSEFFGPGSHILDYGCGTGILSKELGESGFSVTGVDGSSGMIGQADELIRDLSDLEVSFQKIEPQKWNPEEGSFDGIVCSSVLEYVDDDLQLLKKFGRCLKNTGVLLISVPNRKSLLGIFEDCIRRTVAKLGLGGRKDVQYSWRRYSSAEIVDRLSESGLMLERTVYFEAPKLGEFGVKISRFSRIGVMMLLVCRKSSR